MVVLLKGSLVLSASMVAVDCGVNASCDMWTVEAGSHSVVHAPPPVVSRKFPMMC